MTDDELQKMKEELMERIEKVETTLLKEFRKWAVRIEARSRTNEAFATGFNARLDVVEERIQDLENKEGA